MLTLLNIHFPGCPKYKHVILNLAANLILPRQIGFHFKMLKKTHECKVKSKSDNKRQCQFEMYIYQSLPKTLG